METIAVIYRQYEESIMRNGDLADFGDRGLADQVAVGEQNKEKNKE